jgi:hypothetical protein
MVTNGYPQPSNKVTISAGTAFKAGFFGFFGAVTASVIVSIILFVIFGILAVIGLSSIHMST